MKELIWFSIKRRFLNKANLLFIILLFIGTFIIFNLDHIMVIIQPDFNDPLTVKIEQPEISEFLLTSDYKIKVQEQASIVINYFEEQYTISADYPLSIYQQLLISDFLLDYHQSNVLIKMDPNIIAKYQARLNPTVLFKVNNEVEKKDNTTLAFMLVTMIYFMMISFSSMSANEVVYEKTTKLLEIILTTVTTKTHFYAKMLVGWLNILIQSCLSISVVGVVFIYRYLIDKGINLCLCLQKLGLVDENFKSFKDVGKWFAFDSTFISKMMIIMVILMVGIVSVQIIMVSISSFVSNIEESSNIQSPMYILFMGLYYFSLSFNHPASLEKGIGYICSFLPITSMLFMPYRLLLVTVSLSDLMISIGINCGFLIVVFYLGEKIYQKGILHQPSKSNFTWSFEFLKIKKLRKKPNSATIPWYMQSKKH